jgi:hypothetical protein
VSGDALYAAALYGAFWTALLGARAQLASAADAARCVAGLALGALAARAGGLLFAPFGLLLAALLRARGTARARFLGATLPTLPLAFAAAKLGCIAAGCCAAAGAEALGFAAVWAALRATPAEPRGALALAGIGVVRLAALPLRPEARASAWLAGGWLVLAAGWLAHALLRCRPSRGEDPCRPRGNATSNGTHRSSRPGCGGGSAAHPISR